MKHGLQTSSFGTTCDFIRNENLRFFSQHNESESLGLRVKKLVLNLRWILCKLRFKNGACNPSTSGSQGGWSTWGQEFETRWPTWWNSISTKNTKINQIWWQVPVIPATREAEERELLEPSGGGGSEIVPLFSNLGDRAGNSRHPGQRLDSIRRF